MDGSPIGEELLKGWFRWRVGSQLLTLSIYCVSGTGQSKPSLVMFITLGKLTDGFSQNSSFCSFFSLQMSLCEVINWPCSASIYKRPNYVAAKIDTYIFVDFHILRVR